LGQIQEDPLVFHPEKGLAAESVGAMAAYTATFSTVKKGNKDAGGTAISMLSAVPGLGAKKVTALLGSKSIAELCLLSQEALAALEVGGKKLGAVAKALFEALRAKT
jgi:ERCC4-type nuclease